MIKIITISFLIFLSSPSNLFSQAKIDGDVLVQRELEFLLKTLREKRDKFSQHFSPYIALI
jgi:hypothetical protein